MKMKFKRMKTSVVRKKERKKEVESSMTDSVTSGSGPDYQICIPLG